jgi:hypothetical protein
MTYAKLLAELVPTGSSLKTSQAFTAQTKGSLFPESFQHWPKTGSLRNGCVYQRQTLERPINDLDGSVSVTPEMPKQKQSVFVPSDPKELKDAVWPPGGSNRTISAKSRLLPTPTAQAGKHGATRDVHANAHGSNLWDVPHLLPTPTVVDMGRGKTVEEWEQWISRMKEAHGNGNGHGRSLEIEAIKMMPTPTCQDGANTGGQAQLKRNSLPLNALVTVLPSGRIPKQ